MKQVMKKMHPKPSLLHGRDACGAMAMDDIDQNQDQISLHVQV